MKKIKVTLSIGVLVATMAVIGASGSRVAFADEGHKCNCYYGYPPDAQYGTVIDNNCVVNNCPFEIE